MAEREDRLAPPTRSYVIFGLLLVVALSLALCEWLDPHERRGEADSPLRLLIVSADGHAVGSTLVNEGFSVAQFEPDEAIAGGRSLLADDDAPAYRAAIALADQQGFGFVALDLRGPTRWGLSTDDPGIAELPPATASFALFSVGDVAPKGPRMASFGPAEGLEFEGSVAALDSLRLALYDHPDLLRLWTTKPDATQLQARVALDNRGINQRRAALQADHDAWRELAAWPLPTVEGALSGPWEQVQAAPIPGGLLLEVRRLHLRITDRRPQLEADEHAKLYFLPHAALHEADRTAGRRRCVGLPDPEGPVAVAPDGSAVIMRGHDTLTRVYVFEPSPEPEVGCQVRLAGLLRLGERAVGRPNAAGKMAWNYDDDDLRWWGADGEHLVRVRGIDTTSGPWWVDEHLLAQIGEQVHSEIDELDGLPRYSFERALVLIDTAEPEHDRELADEERVRVELGARELFPALDPLSEAASLHDLRPAGAHELLLVTERCADADADDLRPCLVRLAAREHRSLAELAHALADGSLDPAHALSVELLGAIGPYSELAIAADGSRAAWIDEGHLRIAELRGGEPPLARRLDADEQPDSRPRISADGQLVLSEVELVLASGELEAGTVRVARAFVIEAASVQ